MKGSKRNVKGSNKGSNKGNAKHVPSPAQGRGKIVDVLSAKDLQKDIASLMDELRNATERNDKKRIRRMLRTRGHRGGLGIVAQREKERASA